MCADKVSIQLVDDHAVVRSGFKSLIETTGSYSVVAESDCAEDAWKDYLKYKPDIIIMDISMPGIGGIEGIKRILSRDPDAKIVVLTMLGPEVIPRVIKLGAKGCVSKSGPPGTVLKAICAIMQGKIFINDRCVNAEDNPFSNNKKNPFETLSKREFEILIHILSEKKNSEIADLLCLSPKTIHVHKGNILKKVGVASTVGLTRLAISYGILESDPGDLLKEK